MVDGGPVVEQLLQGHLRRAGHLEDRDGGLDVVLDSARVPRTTAVALERVRREPFARQLGDRRGRTGYRYPGTLQDLGLLNGRPGLYVGGSAVRLGCLRKTPL